MGISLNSRHFFTVYRNAGLRIHDVGIIKDVARHKVEHYDSRE
jgi:hypothetical protein